MNAFNSMEGILGESGTTHLDFAFEEFLGQSRLIRGRLGKKAYTFDRYLSIMLGAVNAKTVSEIGIDCSGGSPAQLMCLEILKQKPKKTDNPIYDALKCHIDTNPLDFQEAATQQAVYCSRLSGDILENEMKQFMEELTVSFREDADIVELRDLYGKICVVLGGEAEMEKLSSLFRQRFLIAAPTTVFMQCITNQLVELLLRRDFETSKQVFQLILDEIPVAAETAISD